MLKKQILSQFNNLKQRVDEEVKQFNLKNKEAKDLSKGYFDDLADEISNLPKPKYYDENIRSLNKDIKKLNNHHDYNTTCLLYTSPSPRDRTRSRMPSSA